MQHPSDRRALRTAKSVISGEDIVTAEALVRFQGSRFGQDCREK